ncbi:MAG: hypothetical protein ABI679_07550 [Gemmatimonadota bacterium]
MVDSGVDSQKLDAGTWTGSTTDPSGQVQQVTYDVATIGDTIHVSMALPGGAKLDFSQVHFDKGKLVFSVEMDAGRKISCNLDRRGDGSYSGDCTDSEGKHGRVTMIPPLKEY